MLALSGDRLGIGVILSVEVDRCGIGGRIAVDRHGDRRVQSDRVAALAAGEGRSRHGVIISPLPGRFAEFVFARSDDRLGVGVFLFVECDRCGIGGRIAVDRRGDRRDQSDRFAALAAGEGRSREGVIIRPCPRRFAEFVFAGRYFLDLVEVNVLLGHCGDRNRTVEPAVSTVALQLFRCIQEGEIVAGGHEGDVQKLIVCIKVSDAEEVGDRHGRCLIVDMIVLADQIDPLCGQFRAGQNSVDHGLQEEFLVNVVSKHAVALIAVGDRGERLDAVGLGSEFL